MKPILLTMQAFGSYGEKTEIDFQKGGDFFLISGDTGSGKSTIFDAMMFALYGEVSTNGSGKENELLSQFVDVRNDKPLVSLVFTAHQHGQEETYKITRTPRHIRPAKRTGAKQQEEGETAELLMPDGSQYPSKLSDTNRKIEEIVGLTADQFRKVGMIAQGEFMDFLRAGSKEKTELLRDLLKTDYYYQLSERLKTLAKEKNTAAKTQRANMSFFAGRAVTEGLPEEDAQALEAAWKYVFVCSTGIAMAYLGILLLAAALVFVDGMFSAVLAFGAALKPYIPWIAGSIAALLAACYLGRLLLIYRHRRMEQEYAYRREVLEKTGIVLVSKGSIPLNRGIEPLQAVEGGGYALPPGPAYTPEEAAADAAALEAGEKKGEAPAEDIVDVDPEDLGEAPKDTAAPRKDDVTDADVVVKDGKPKA